MRRRGMPVCCGEVLRWGVMGFDVPAPDVIHRGSLVCCDEVLCWSVLPGERAVDALAPLRVSLL